MKKILPLLLMILLLPTMFAISLDVKVIDSNEVLVVGLNEPATFKLKIKNQELSGNFEFYNLEGFSMAPKGTVFLSQGQTQNIDLVIYPREDFDSRNFYNFNYFIRDSSGMEVKEDVLIKVVELKNVFEIGADEIDPESNLINIYISNKENFDFDKIDVKFYSEFFEIEKSFALNAEEKKDFIVELDKEKFEELVAGFYTLNAEISVEDVNAKIEGIIEFSEKNIVTTTKKDYGWIVITKAIKKKNSGNIMAKSETVVSKNIISRLFTTFNPEPDSSERKGFVTYYTWANELNPGETLEIVVKTNWLFPFLIAFFILIIIIFIKKYTETHLAIQKRVSFVRAKGGEFALKVTLVINARRYVERVSVVDRLPMLVKLYEKFGIEKPFRIDEKNRRVEWTFDKLEQGEIRVVNYIIYSKIGILGKFALPSAVAVYEKEGKVHESESNKAFFVAEQKGKGDED